MNVFKLMSGMALLVAAGCASVPDATADLQKQSAFPQIAAVFEHRDYAELKPMLSEELSEQLTLDNFEAMVAGMEKNGKLVSIEYLSGLRSPAAKSELWKLTFCRENAAGEAVIVDKILRVMYGTLDGRAQIIGIMVQ